MSHDDLSSHHETRRHDGAVTEQIRINEERAARSKAETSPGDTRTAFYVILVIVLFKPAVESGIALYTYLWELVCYLASFLGF